MMFIKSRTVELIECCPQAQRVGGHPVLQPHHNCWVNCLKSSRPDRLCQVHHTPGRNMAKCCWSLAAQICHYHFYRPTHSRCLVEPRCDAQTRGAWQVSDQTQTSEADLGMSRSEGPGSENHLKILKQITQDAYDGIQRDLDYLCLLYSDCTRHPLVHLDANMPQQEHMVSCYFLWLSLAVAQMIWSKLGHGIDRDNHDIHRERMAQTGGPAHSQRHQHIQTSFHQNPLLIVLSTHPQR